MVLRKHMHTRGPRGGVCFITGAATTSDWRECVASGPRSCRFCNAHALGTCHEQLNGSCALWRGPGPHPTLAQGLALDVTPPPIASEVAQGFDLTPVSLIDEAVS